MYKANNLLLMQWLFYQSNPGSIFSSGQIVTEKEIILLCRKKSLSNTIKTVIDTFSFYAFPGVIPPPAPLSPGVGFIPVVVEAVLQ